MSPTTKPYAQLALAALLGCVAVVLVQRNLTGNLSDLAANWRAFAAALMVGGLGVYQARLGSVGLLKAPPPVVAPSDEPSKSLAGKLDLGTRALVQAVSDGNDPAAAAALKYIEAMAMAKGKA
jgi:hypothetical protein